MVDAIGEESSVSEADIVQFWVSANEHCERISQLLVVLEKGPDEEVIADLYRQMHTLKGDSGFLNLTNVGRVAHAAESLLSSIRDGHAEISQATIDSLLEASDILASLVAFIGENGCDSGEEFTDEITACLQSLSGQLEVGAARSDDSVLLNPAPVDAAEGFVLLNPAPVDAAEGFVLLNPAPVDAAEGFVLLNPAPPQAPTVDTQESAGIPDVSGTGVLPPDVPRPRIQLPDPVVRVSVPLLDKLVTLVGELVLTRNQIVQGVSEGSSTDLDGASQQLDIITSELQESVIRTRMQPISQVWDKVPRQVRDLSRQLGRTVDLRFIGSETELDRTLLEALQAPLTHLIRNSLDHGIETPAERIAAGKSAAGQLTLSARHQSGQVVIEISDDGKGMDADKIRSVAVARGVLNAAEAAALSTSEVHQLIFKSGFSTASEVTDVSGRGVGMDVVRSNIEAISGTVGISSTQGEGTTIRVTIPLTLAIIPALIVSSAGHLFALPHSSLDQLVLLNRNATHGPLVTIEGSTMLELGDELVPLVWLAEVLGENTSDQRQVTVVVVSSDEVRYGLVVEQVLTTQEIVVKPLSRQVKSLDVYSGASVMGDGRIALIVDIPGLGAMAGASLNSRGVRQAKAVVPATEDGAGHLLVRVGSTRAVMPLAAAARLELFGVDQIEWAGGTPVVQYSGAGGPLLQLKRLDTALGLLGEDPFAADRENVSVLVLQAGPNAVGVVIDELIDIVTEEFTLSPAGARPGVLGTGVVAGQVADVVDLHPLLEGHY